VIIHIYKVESTKASAEWGKKSNDDIERCDVWVM